MSLSGESVGVMAEHYFQLQKTCLLQLPKTCFRRTINDQEVIISHSRFLVRVQNSTNVFSVFCLSGCHVCKRTRKPNCRFAFLNYMKTIRRNSRLGIWFQEIASVFARTCKLGAARFNPRHQVRGSKKIGPFFDAVQKQQQIHELLDQSAAQQIKSAYAQTSMRQLKQFILVNPCSSRFTDRCPRSVRTNCLPAFR